MFACGDGGCPATRFLRKRGDGTANCVAGAILRLIDLLLVGNVAFDTKSGGMTNPTNETAHSPMKSHHPDAQVRDSAVKNDLDGEVPPTSKNGQRSADDAQDPQQASAPDPEQESAESASPAEARTPRSGVPFRVKIGSLRDGETKAKARPQPESAAGDSAEPAADRQGPPVARPNPRQQLPPELEQQFQDAVGEASVEQLLDSAPSAAQELEPDSRVKGRVVSVRGDDVFVDLGGRNQGVVPGNQFQKIPDEGTVVEVDVRVFDSQEGLYKLTLPGAVVDVGDWSQVTEGTMVEATVTGHNKGGLVCKVGSLRGFVPASQVSLFRTNDLDKYVGQKLVCVVTESKRKKRNLVLSRRAVLEREKAEEKQKVWEALEVGQIREGVVRNLQDFGAFVDLGGVDGLIHVSQLGWERVNHPREVLEVGQKVQVRINKIDRSAQRISLAYRDLMDSPWEQAEQRYPVSTRVKGIVSKIMDFGALVRLEPGVSGLIHISELSHKRVGRVSDVLQEGQEVEVQVQSVDVSAQRISLSRKALEPRPAEPQPRPLRGETAAGKDASSNAAAREKDSRRLRGGLDHGAGGERFGLKW